MCNAERHAISCLLTNWTILLLDEVVHIRATWNETVGLEIAMSMKVIYGCIKSGGSC